jgi:hypothetical protein
MLKQKKELFSIENIKLAEGESVNSYETQVREQLRNVESSRNCLQIVLNFLLQLTAGGGNTHACRLALQTYCVKNTGD